MIPSYQGLTKINLNKATLMAIVQEWLGSSTTIVGDPKMKGVRVIDLKYEDDWAVFTLKNAEDQR